jgi:predicted SAM-dependent methyltransferase
MGRYHETSIHDDWEGVLHCTNKKCNHEVKRYKSDDNPPTKHEEPQLSPTNEELYELQENLWNTYKTLGYQGEEFMYEHSFGFALDDFARAVLAKWGQS